MPRQFELSISVQPVKSRQGFSDREQVRIGREGPGIQNAGLGPATGRLGPTGQLVPLGRASERLSVPEEMPVRLKCPFHLGLAAPEFGHPIGLAGPLGQLGEAFQRPRGRGFKPEPSLEGGSLRSRIALAVPATTPAARAALRRRAARGRVAAPHRSPRRVGRSRAPTRSRPSTPAHQHFHARSAPAILAPPPNGRLRSPAGLS